MKFNSTNALKNVILTKTRCNIRKIQHIKLKHELKSKKSEIVFDYKKNNSPLIIGAVGGSGTRIVCQIVKDAGYFMGENLNKSYDSMDIFPFMEEWVRPYLSRKISNSTNKKMIDEISFYMSKHLTSKHDKITKWGFKLPQTQLLLPFFHSIFPEMKFIHVMRDGRDMSFSKNQRQARFYGEIICGNKSTYKNSPSPLYCLKYWSMVNRITLDYGSSKLKNNYLLIRFEDIVNKPHDSIKKIYSFIGIELNDSLEIINKIKKPTTLGRWKSRSNELSEMTNFEKETLSKFGYD